MNLPASLQPPALALAALAVLVGGSVVNDFCRARLREPVHDRFGLPLVTRERAAGWDAPWEIRGRSEVSVLVRGLAPTEKVIGARRPWRQGLAPATVLTVSPRPGPVRLQYAFDNGERGQVLRVRVAGREVERRDPVPLGSSRGEITVPGAAEPVAVELAFSRSASPGGDPRAITVTFRELTLQMQ